MRNFFDKLAMAIIKTTGLAIVISLCWLYFFTTNVIFKMPAFIYAYELEQDKELLK